MGLIFARGGLAGHMRARYESLAKPVSGQEHGLDRYLHAAIDMDQIDSAWLQTRHPITKFVGGLTNVGHPLRWVHARSPLIAHAAAIATTIAAGTDEGYAALPNTRSPSL